MRYKILIDPHPFLESVLNSLQDQYDVELLSLSSAIQHYEPQCTTVSYTAPNKLNLKDDTLSGFPSWFTENTSTVEHIVIQSLKEQLIKYGPWIEAMDLCLQNEDISLILLWNDVTALTKSLTFLGKRYGIPSLHVSHGIPLTAEAHGKIWADKIAVFGDSSRVFYLANGNRQEKIVITGNPYWDNWGPCSSHDVKKIKGTLGLKNDKKVVMFAPTWYHNFRTARDPELKLKRDLEILLDTMSQLKIVDKVDLLVKLHGGHKDKAAFYDRNIKSRGFSYKIIAEASPLPLIQVSDVILCSGSMVVEALLAGKPIIYNVCDQFESEQHFNFFMSHSFTLDKAPFYVSLNRDDLSRDLNRALNNCDDFSTEEIKKFLHRQNGPCDGKAAERVAELTIEMAVNKKNKEKRVKFISPVSYQKRETYYSNIREDIPSIITGNPQKILEVGCAEGVLGAFLKKKYNCEYIGVEINSEAACKAEKRLDRVVIADVEKVNLKEYRIAETGFDYIIYGDVLEHLYDPWTVIFEHKKLLRHDGYVVVSIPNVRNLKVIESLVNGNWTYKDEGILDSTHLRFFTLQEIKKMFINCGYDIVDIKCITNPIFDFSKIQGQVNIDLPKMTIKNVSKEEMSELSTVQFIIKAKKATVSELVRHPKCSIIIPIFNQAEYTRQCIETLYKNTSSSLFEVIVVDNNSTDGTKEYLSSIPEKVKVIANKENLGFAKACNQGAEHSKGYYLVFLNNDTLPQHGWLDEMINTAEKDSLVGMVGSRLLYPDSTIQHAGVYFNEHGIPYHAFRSAPGDHPAALITRETPGVTGACMLMPKQLFQHIGGFNEEYHMYVEDVDLCLRTWDAGFKVVYCAESILTHFESASITDVNRRDAHVREAWNHLHKSWRNKWPTILQGLTPEGTLCKIDLHSDPKRSDKALKALKVLWHAPIFDPSGYADEARNFILQLQSQNIEPAVREIGRRSDVFRNGIGEQERVQLDEAIEQEISEDFISIIQFPAYAFERIRIARYHIGRTTFETNGLPADWIQKCNLMDEIWVPSEFNMQTFKAAGVTSKLFKVPEGVNVRRFRPGLDELKIPGTRGVVFLSIFEWIYRKGWDVLLKSWAKAFGPDDNVSLVLRTYPMNVTGSDEAKQKIEDRINQFLKTELKISRQDIAPVIVLADQLHDSDMPRLYAAVDAYVLPSRGEGWGRTQMEAMACGLPVLSTRWSGNLEFMNDHNSLLLDINGLAIIDERAEIQFYRGQKWAEPSVEHLSELMHKVVENPTEVRNIGRRARLDIERYWGWERIAAIAAKRLRAINTEIKYHSVTTCGANGVYTVMWEGSQFVNHSLALVNRELCIELAKRKDIELSLIPYEPDEFGVGEDPDRFGLIEERLRKPLSGVADFHVRHQWPPNFTSPREGHWIIIQPWEFGALPKDWVEPMETLVDELWVPSNHVRDVYINSGISPDKVFVVPNGVNYDQFYPGITKFPLDTNKKFKFLFVGGTIMRKGIDVLLNAYTEAFTSEDDVCLVIKDMGGNSFYKGQNASQMIEDIKKDPASPEILYIAETLKHEEIAGVYTACDCLVHPYRGEGFGLPVAEAMACGLPVIVTKGGACDDFCSEKNAYLIESTVKPVHLNNYVLSAPGWLLEPDKTHLIERLRFVYEQPEKAKEKGTIAAHDIKKKVNWEMASERIRDRFKKLKNKPILRFEASAHDHAGKDMKSPQEIYQSIQQSMKNKRPEEVINGLEMLAESSPEFALAHNDLGVLHYNAGDREKALKFYENAVQLDSGNMIFQKNLADFYYLELGRIEEALKIYVNILTTHPQDIETLLATGQICAALEKPGDARDFFNRVLEIEPWNEAARQNLDELERPPSPGAIVNVESPDEIYERLKQNLSTLSQVEAIDELEKLLGSYPDFALGHNDLGVLYYHNGDKEKTLHHYRQAAQLQPENLIFQKNLADLLFVELGKIEEALQIYVNILAVNPHDVETLLITGHICVGLKKFDDARNFYHRVLELEPGNEDAGNNLRALNKHPAANGLSPAESANSFSVLTDKVESDDLEADRPAAGQQAATVSIIISLDGIQNRVKECIKSVMEHTSDPHEILLINRGATKGLLKWAQQLAKDNDHYHIIGCARQAGWAEFLNQAIQKAGGEMVVLLHNDVVVPEGWLKAFKMCINLVPNIGAVGPMSNRTGGIQQIIYSDESDRVEFESAAKAFYEQNQYRRVVTRKLSDFCLAFPRELPDKIGYFDEQFVSEEVVVEDFCKRAASGGYQNLIAADTYVYHYDRHKNKKNASTINSASTADRKKYKEKWNGTQNPEVKALQTVQLLARTEELSQKGKIDAAVEVLLGGIGVQPEDPRFYLALSEILLTAKKFQDAKEALTEMPSADEKQEMRKAQLLAYAEEGLENYEAAQAQIEQVLLMNSGHAPALNLKGILAYRNDDCPSAEKYFKRAIDADPGYGEPYTNLGMLQLEADQQEEALKSFEKGFRLTPTDFDIATNYHTLIAGIAEYQKAENVARDVAFLYPNNQKIKYMLIDFLVQQGKYEMAMPEIEDAIIKFGTDNGILSAALKVREKLGPITIQKSLEKVPVSLCMIIKDEEKYLAKCLASVKPIVDEMIVVDTGSTDRSKDIATTFGAKVYDYEWKNDFAEARNYSISKASGEWILILDGDEVISPLDHAHFSKMVKKTPRVPIAYSIITRNYNKLANIVGWIPNDGTYLEEEAAIGWLPSEKVRLFYGKDQIWFEGAVHELVDPVLKKNGIEIKKCHLPVHHYGRLDNEKLERKGEIYFDIGKKKLSAMGDDLNALRELAVQATILEKNQEAFELWQRLLSLNPIPNLAAIAYVNMGTIYSRLGKFEDALDAGKKAVKHDPDLKEARYNHAMAELHCGNAPKTIRVLEDLLKGFPDYPPARFILSAAYCCAHQKEKGLEGIRKLRDTPMGTHLDIPCLELAQSLISAGKMEYALWVLGAAIESDIVNPQLLALFKECLNMKDATQNCSHIPQPPQANFQGAIFENLPQ